MKPAERRKQAALLHEPSAQAGKFVIADRPCFLQPIKLVDFICDAEADNAPQLIARLLGLLRIALGHPFSLKDQIRKHGKIWEHNRRDHPDRLGPA